MQSQSPHPHYLSPPTPNSHYLNPPPPPLSLASCRKANNLLEYNDLCGKGWRAIAKPKSLGCLSTTSLPILPIKGVLTQSDKKNSGFRVPPLQVMGSEDTFSGIICKVVFDRHLKALDYTFVFCKNQNLPSCTQFGLCQDQKVEMFKDDACCSSELVAHPNY